MSLRTGMNAPAVLIDKYINSAYDTVKLVADNIGAIIETAALVGAYIVSDTAPTTRTDGSALRDGDRWYNSSNDITYAWSGSAWRSIGTNQTIVETQFATASQATFTLVNPYAPGTNNLLVFVDGVFQLSKSISAVNGSYTESSATVITFDTPLTVNTQVTFIIGDVITDSVTALSITKQLYTAVGTISAGTPVTIPNGSTYTLGNGSLSVSVNGLTQYLAANAYAETNTTQVTFTDDLVVGDQVLFTITIIS